MMRSNCTPKYTSVARGLWLVALLIAIGTTVRLWPSRAFFTLDGVLPCLAFVEWRVEAEVPQLRCLHEVNTVIGCRAVALDLVYIDKNGGCSVEAGGMSGRLRLAAGLPLDINRATAEDFALLSGIGPSRAEAIIQSRLDRGTFESVNALKRVPGIGEGTITNLSPFIEVALSPVD